MQAQPISELNALLAPDVAKRLSFMLNDVEKGKDLDVRTPLFSDISSDEILERFLEEVFNPISSRLNGTLSELEDKQADKFGTRSFQEPWSVRKVNLLNSYAAKDGIPDFDLPGGLPGRCQLRPSNMDTVYGAMKRSTSAGLPYLRRKGDVLDATIIIEPKEWPAVLFTRTQEGGKTRDVWGYPIYTLSIEGQFFLPYFEKFRLHPCLSAYSGPDAVDDAISRMLFTKGSDHVVYCEDFEAFDQSVSPEFTNRIFNYIGDAFQAESHDSYDFATVSTNFSDIGIVSPDGILTGSHGIPSGSWFTSVVGSFVHLVAQNAVTQIDGNRNQVMGDDGVSLLSSSLDLEYITDVYSTFGLTLNQEKTFVSKDEVLYLQRYYCSDYKFGGTYRGVYPVIRALNRLIHMERWTSIDNLEGADFFAIRAIAILENCKWHPMFVEFVKWIVENDKYNLEYTVQGLKEFVRSFQPKTSTTIRNQYSDDIIGINNFETVKILKTL